MVEMARTITMAGGKYPISDQHSAISAWRLRNNGKGVSEEAVVAHIRAACKALGLRFPGEDRETAALSGTMIGNQLKPHGFVYPLNMPPCNQCGLDPNRGAHVNPQRSGGGFAAAIGEQRIISARLPHHAVKIHRSHVYGTGYLGFGARIPCQACGQPMSGSAHIPGLPCGTGGGVTPMTSGGLQQAAAGAADGELQPTTPVGKLLLVEGPEKLVISAQAVASRELAQEWETAARKNPHFTWIDGAYVEAETPNRNAAMWSTSDLENGESTVANGPLNWLHEERHVIGTIAAARLVPEAGGVKAHIRSLAAMWSYLYPQEARQVAAASDERKLWYSMECVSREVACLTDGCTHRQLYNGYMREKAKRCEHVIAGGPRRFVDPQFLGGAVILGAVRPGWAGAHAEVLRQAASFLPDQAQYLPDLTEEEQVHMLAQIIDYAA